MVARGFDIAQLEAINLVTALKNLLPLKPLEYKIVINTDNMTSQQVLSSGAGKDDVICECARQIWLVAADVVITHKPGKEIVFADALSRMSFDHGARNIVLDVIANSDLKPVFVSNMTIYWPSIAKPGIHNTPFCLSYHVPLTNNTSTCSLLSKLAWRLELGGTRRGRQRNT